MDTAEQPPPAQTRWQALQQRLGQQLAQRLFDEIATHPADMADVHPGRRPARVRSWSLGLAYLLGVLVYALSVGAAALGVFLLWPPWDNVYSVFFGVVLLLAFWVARPRRASVPHGMLARADYPVLHSLSDRIAQAMGSVPLNGIALSADFNAAYSVCGWRTRRYMTLGAPLVAILTPPERLALIAHELSHGANGDPLRGQFLFGAVGTVAGWAETLHPGSIGNAGDRSSEGGGLISVVAIPFELVMLAASMLVTRLARAMLLLVLRESQRAEYLADRLAAAVAGPAAMRSGLDKLCLHEVVDAAIQRHAEEQVGQPLMPSLRSAVDTLTPMAWQQWRDQDRAQQRQVDATHPPTALRIAMLDRAAAAASDVSAGAAAAGAVQPVLVLSDAELAQFDAECTRLLVAMQRELSNRALEEANG